MDEFQQELRQMAESEEEEVDEEEEEEDGAPASGENVSREGNALQERGSGWMPSSRTSDGLEEVWRHPELQQIVDVVQMALNNSHAATDCHVLRRVTTHHFSVHWSSADSNGREILSSRRHIEGMEALQKHLEAWYAVIPDGVLRLLESKVEHVSMTGGLVVVSKLDYRGTAVVYRSRRMINVIDTGDQLRSNNLLSSSGGPSASLTPGTMEQQYHEQVNAVLAQFGCFVSWQKVLKRFSSWCSADGGQLREQRGAAISEMVGGRRQDADRGGGAEDGKGSRRVKRRREEVYKSSNSGKRSDQQNCLAVGADWSHADVYGDHEVLSDRLRHGEEGDDGRVNDDRDEDRNDSEDDENDAYSREDAEDVATFFASSSVYAPAEDVSDDVRKVGGAGTLALRVQGDHRMHVDDSGKVFRMQYSYLRR